MTKAELEQLVADPLADEQQRADAQALLDKLNISTSSTGEFDSSAEMWASLARTDANPERRAKQFADLRERYKLEPSALRSFTPERETLRVKRNVYDQHGGDVIGQAYDEDIPALLAEKGRGYYGTVDYYISMRGMTPAFAVLAAKEHGERQHTNALIDEGCEVGCGGG